MRIKEKTTLMHSLQPIPRSKRMVLIFTKTIPLNRYASPVLQVF